MKNREKTGKAFRIKWLLLALVAASGSTQGCGISESRMDHTEGEQ